MLGFLQRELEPKREGESHLIFGEVDQRQLSWRKTYRGTKGMMFQLRLLGTLLNPLVMPCITEWTCIGGHCICKVLTQGLALSAQ